MKQSLTLVALAAAVLLATLAWRGQGRDWLFGSAKNSPQTAVLATDSPVPMASAAPLQGSAQRGDELMLHAAREVAALSSLDARLRVQTNLMEQELVGSGSYYQLRSEHDLLLKLELRLQVAQQVSSLLQVSDGRFLWIRRNLPGQNSLSRVDQRRVREALAKGTKLPSTDPSRALALGGLGKLLESLAENFEFSAPREDTFSSTAVWVLHGKWRPERLAELVPSKRSEIVAGEDLDWSELPEQLPTQVMVMLGRDAYAPLFPYRIEYQRLDRAGEVTPLVSLDLFDVRTNVSLDPRLFAYKPGDQEVADVTETYLAKLQRR
jgi:hypothetical protein